ncbi:hypothetical protein PG994_012296 [Apiospora phragmitis]|uniref:Uncharacterized protein n=1 Tax=Apiospora phragmitis TaxID=2905665 RepID=A0ABR1TV93_9PEZI
MRDEPWADIQHRLETTLGLQLPPNPKTAWVAAQAAMGLKGIRFAPGSFHGEHLPAGAVTLGRLDCGMSEAIRYAKETFLPIDYIYSPQRGDPDIADVFRNLIYRCSLKGISHTSPSYLADWRERQPIFWPVGVIRDLSQDNLGRVIVANRALLGRESRGPISALPFLQFISEILWRCCYIIESSRAMAPDGGLGLNLLNLPLEDLINFARKGRCYWPWLGPNIALDAFIFEHGILREKEPFNVGTSFLVRMYGMGIRDLSFLQRNPNLDEWREQLDALHRCHLLRSWLGKENSADLKEQLEFCYFSMAASMRHANSNNRQTRHPPGMETHEKRIKARQREFKILTIMVDRVWQEIELYGGHRRIPILLRRKPNAAGQMREGDWHLLELAHQRILLGGQTQYHDAHPHHASLLRQWLPDLANLHSNNFVQLDAALYSSCPPLSAASPMIDHYGFTYPTPITSKRFETFIDEARGRGYYAPEILEEFIEIRDYSVLKKPPPILPDTFAPEPKGYFNQVLQKPSPIPRGICAPEARGYFDQALQEPPPGFQNIFAPEPKGDFDQLVDMKKIRWGFE